MRRSPGFALERGGGERPPRGGIVEDEQRAIARRAVGVHGAIGVKEPVGRVWQRKAAGGDEGVARGAVGDAAVASRTNVPRK